LAIADCDLHCAAAALVEIGMRSQKSLLLGFARALAAEAVDVMMAVALDVCDPEQTDERQVLLKRESRWGGEILARDKVARRVAGGVPMGAARGVQHRLVEPLARLARNAGVAERTSSQERVERGIRLVDQHRLRSRERGDADLLRCIARQRLLDPENARRKSVQRTARFDRVPERDDAVDLVELLVAVEGDVIRIGDPLQDCRGAADAIEVGGGIARKLELEVARPMRGDDFLERFGQTVTEASLDLVRRERIEQPDRMAQRNLGARLQRAEQRRKVDAT